MSEAVKLESNSVIDAFRAHEHFARVMLDAYALVDHTGRVVKANQLFGTLVGKKTKEVLKADSFDQLLTMSIGEDSLDIAKLLGHQTPTRIDEVRGSTATQNDLNFIISVYPFNDEKTGMHLGAFILIRDVTAEKALHDKFRSTAIKSVTDPLTGLNTRRFFEDWFTSQMRHARDVGERPEISLIMVDIDFFKKVNDVYGHQAGDHVLATVGRIMKKTFRKTDVPCRYGGEEFLVILQGTSLRGAAVVAEKLRAAVKDEVIEFDGKTIPVTISCGVAELVYGDETYQETMKRADEALYRSKKDGRNMVSIHDGSAIKKFS